MMRKSEFLALLCAIALGAAGCASKRIVRAAPPSVSTPPPEEVEPMPQPEAPPPVKTVVEPPPAEALPLPPLVPAKRPAPPRPRPSPAESGESGGPKPAPPQISPQLSARDLAATKTNTSKNMLTAQQNLQMANGKQLNAAQKDLADKIRGFLAEARGAITANDWVRAQNLAEKAQVLSVELVKSF
jgi:hypothetical protein